MPAARELQGCRTVFTYQHGVLNMAEYLIKTITLEGTFDLSAAAVSVAGSTDTPPFSPAATTRIVVCPGHSDAPPPL